MSYVGGLRNILESPLDARADIRINDMTIQGETIDQLNVMYYGAVGDGVTDDTSAIQSAINFAKQFGGEVYFPSGTYGVSAELNLGSNTFAFSLRGDGYTSIIKRISGTSSIMGGNTINNLRISDLLIDGNQTTLGSGNHGISIFDANNVFVESVKVQDYANSGILIYINEATATPGDFVNCWVRNCEVDGKNVCNNGILLTDMFESGITGCVVRNIQQAGSPSYAVQLKNKCNKCVVSDCSIDVARGGIVFGNDMAEGTIGVEKSVVSNCSISNCYFGIYIGTSRDNVISGMTIDMNSDVNSNEPIRMLGTTIDEASSNNNNVIKNCVVKNPRAAKYIVRLDQFVNNCYVEVDLLDDSTTTTLGLFGADTDHNTIKFNRAKDRGNLSVSSLFLDNNTSADNRFIYNDTKSKGLKLPTYSLLEANALSTITEAGTIIYVSNGAAGNPVIAFSNGVTWLRCDTLAAIS